jgi:hypothetical protein
MTGPEDHELRDLGYVVTADPPAGYVLTLNGKIIARSIMDTNLWSCARRRERMMALGLKDDLPKIRSA